MRILWCWTLCWQCAPEELTLLEGHPKCKSTEDVVCWMFEARNASFLYKEAEGTCWGFVSRRISHDNALLSRFEDNKRRPTPLLFLALLPFLPSSSSSTLALRRNSRESRGITGEYRYEVPDGFTKVPNGVRLGEAWALYSYLITRPGHAIPWSCQCRCTTSARPTPDFTRPA
jgi:hypothetical protein